MKRWTKKRRVTLETIIDDVFLFCGLSESAKKDTLTLGYLSKTHPRDFREAETLLFAPGNSEEVFGISDETQGYLTNVQPTDVPRYDASVCRFIYDDNLNPYTYLWRLKEVSMKQARGKKIYSPHVAMLHECFVDSKSGEYHGSKRLVNKVGREWVQLGTTNERQYFIRDKATTGTGERFLGFEDCDPEITTRVCQLILGVQFSREFEWRVVVKSSQGVSLSFPTDAKGAMAAFKQRDANKKTGRRDALRNWVKEHYRRKSRDLPESEKEIKVRQHLRGRTPFRWLGMDCELVVAPFDVRRNEILKERREAEKQTA